MRGKCRELTVPCELALPTVLSYGSSRAVPLQALQYIRVIINHEEETFTRCTQ